MIETVVTGILALAEPYYLASVSSEQLERDLVDEVRLFGLFLESEMGDVARYVQGRVASRPQRASHGHWDTPSPHAQGIYSV